jgi:ABC-2 family transporter protein
MYARLWWKDARQFGPIWVFLALCAAVVQWLFLYFVGKDEFHGALGMSALICASLYAFATGAAAFAGEREMGTLRLLDSLPADRRVVWTAKVSFAVVTTLALTLLLVAMAALYTDRWKTTGSLSIWEALSFGMLVPIALGWGLFWSAILSNALAAAVTAIFCAAVSLSFVTNRLDDVYLGRVNLSTFVLCECFLFLATLIASAAIFTRLLRWKDVHVEFQSPIVVNRPGSTSPRRTQLQVQSPVAAMLASRPAVGPRHASATDHSLHRSRVAEARAMVWQTVKEGRKTWGLLAALGSLAPALARLRFFYVDPTWLVLIGIGISLVAGASVFGLENRARTQRFLAHHGARPGLVWMVKLAVWSVGLVVIWVPLLLMMALVAMRRTGASAQSIEDWLAVIFVMTFYPGVALLCGMAIRRGITAVVIAMVTSLALTIPLVSLVNVGVLPLQGGLLVIPAGVVAVSWAWSGDWLLDRPAPGRWVRLGLLFTGMSTLIVTWYAGYRAWSIRDVGPIAPPATWIEAAATPSPAGENAADLYREAGRRLVGPFSDSPEFLDRNQAVLDLLRRAAALPDCRFLKPDKLTVLDQPDLPPVSQLGYLLTFDATERQSHGDLAGAWDDIMVLFRMAHHVGAGSGFIRAFPDALSLERSALGHALEWAIARGQTPERLHSALAACRRLPKVAPTADIVRAEANVVENTLDLPADKLREWAFKWANSGPGVLFVLGTTPWERIRARRVNRLLANAAIEDTMHEPWQRSHTPHPEIEYAQTTSRTAMMLIRNVTGYVAAFDMNEVARRALVQVLALRAWQLQHDGQFPKSLEALVPAELASLPIDPFSGRPFGYIPSHGQDIPPLRTALTPSPDEGHGPIPGSWLLYSVGPDGLDDGGITFTEAIARRRNMDIVFEIPPSEGGGASK